jgi:hypothetical protein
MGREEMHHYLWREQHSQLGNQWSDIFQMGLVLRIIWVLGPLVKAYLRRFAILALLEFINISSLHN